jgi:hypothetical protein
VATRPNRSSRCPTTDPAPGPALRRLASALADLDLCIASSEIQNITLHVRAMLHCWVLLIGRS